MPGAVHLRCLVMTKEEKSYSDITSCSFSLTALSISLTYLSVSSWTSFSASFRSSSESSLAFFCALSLSTASRRMLRMATLEDSPSLETCLHSSLRRSSVGAGNTRRITEPSSVGLMPTSEAWIALLMSLRVGSGDGSQLLDRGRRAVVVDGHTVQNGWRCLACADGAELTVQRIQRLIHLLFNLFILCFHNCLHSAKETQLKILRSSDYFTSVPISSCLTARTMLSGSSRLNTRTGI